MDDRLTIISNEIQPLLASIQLRPTLETIIRIGTLLTSAKRICGHGRWLPWLKAHGIAPRTAETYMQVSNSPNSANLPERLSVNEFLHMIRRGKREARAAERERVRREAIAANPVNDETYQIHHADCKTFSWPENISLIGTDPPWNDMDAYSWLASMAKDKLCPGGLLLVQIGQYYLHQVLDIMRGSGLTYQWLMAIGYKQYRAKPWGNVFLNNWKAVVVLSNGRMKWQGDKNSADSPCVNDIYMVEPNDQLCHKWQQPLDPWIYWLDRLSVPGSLIVDPFAGSGTIGCAVKIIGGGRKYIGTDIDAENCRVARKQIEDCTESDRCNSPSVCEEEQ